MAELYNHGHIASSESRICYTQGPVDDGIHYSGPCWWRHPLLRALLITASTWCLLEPSERAWGRVDTANFHWTSSSHPFSHLHVSFHSSLPRDSFIIVWECCLWNHDNFQSMCIFHSEASLTCCNGDGRYTKYYNKHNQYWLVVC